MGPDERIDLDGAVLTRLRGADGPAMSEVLSHNIEHLTPWMPWVDPDGIGPAAQTERSHDAERWWDDGTDYVYVLRGPDEAIIGSFGLHRRIGPGAIEIGYWMDARHTGRGHATRATRALTDQTDRLDDVLRTEIHTDEANVISAAIPRRLGYRLDRVDERAPQAPGETGRLQIWVHATPR